MPTLDWNKKVWGGGYAWSKDGDEWDDSARYCGIPYDSWKDQLRRTFIVPHVRPQSEALEIGPGHGRWSVLIAPKVRHLQLVDLNPSCIEFCRSRLINDHQNVNYHVNDGRTLGILPDGCMDFVWSFDTFVHIDEPEVRSYAKELHRVMKAQAIGVIHHPGNATLEQRRNGCRSDLDGKKFSAILADNGLHVIRQTGEWGAGCNMALTGDLITVFARP